MLCESTNLKEVLNFNNTPLANSYVSNLKKKEKFFPLICVSCKDCHHLQLKHIVNPKLMFENYMYVSGTSPVLVKHFENFYLKVTKKFKIDKQKDRLLDIACNDGTFLNFFKKNKFQNVIGVEPARNLRKLNLKKKIDINTIFFDYKNSFKLKHKYKSFKIITANNVFAHVPNLKNFAMGVKNILSDDGVFIFEVSYLKDVIKKLTFDTIYHEHMSYHSLKPLINFFRSIKMQIIDFDLIEAQGGSIRVYVSHENSLKISKKKIKSQIKKETDFGLFKQSIYQKYNSRINKQRILINNFLEKELLKRKYIVGYGAPAKVTTFCHVFNLSKKHIDLIVDDNSLKQNKYTPGKNIKIISFEKLKKLRFDYIIILAWNFSIPIIKKLKQTFKNRKIKIIIPFPKIKII